MLDTLSKYKEVCTEPKGKEADFDEIIEKYYKSISKYEKEQKKGAGITGGLMFAVCRGKISEGIDFSDNRARLVICVGIPFPNVQGLFMFNFFHKNTYY